jgi:hypothetical protein
MGMCKNKLKYEIQLHSFFQLVSLDSFWNCANVVSDVINNKSKINGLRMCLYFLPNLLAFILK